MFRALPTEVLLQLCRFFIKVLATLDIPESWGTVGSSLIPKVVGAASLSKLRAIACLPVARKLLGYLWLQMLPKLFFVSFQCGFVAGSHEPNGVYVVKRTAELSKEWGTNLYVAQVVLLSQAPQVPNPPTKSTSRTKRRELPAPCLGCDLLDTASQV